MSDESANPRPDDPGYDLALQTDVGTNRPDNEDACGHALDPQGGVIFAVADGVGGYEGGEVASQMAIEITIEAFSKSPANWGQARRLARAVQEANIAIHNRALAVPELRRMATTLTAVAIKDGAVSVAHVGDCRLYMIHNGRIKQVSRDHTLVGERVRMGLMTAAEGRHHPERSALSRSIGRDLIVSLDRISIGLDRDDRLIVCSDGLHGVLEDQEIEHISRNVDASEACRRLVDSANARGTADNLTVAVFRQLAEPAAPAHAHRRGLGRLWASVARLWR